MRCPPPSRCCTRHARPRTRPVPRTPGRSPIPTELADARPQTAWRAEPNTGGQGQFFTFEPRAASAKAAELRIVGAGRGFARVKRIAIVGATGAWHVDLADSDGPQVVELPQPIAGCVSVVIEAAHRGGTVGIGELAVYSEGERTGGGEAALAHVIADGGEIAAATQALARRGAAGAAALDVELQRATSEGARTRLVRALAKVHDPSVGPMLAHAIAQARVEDRELDPVLAAMGAQGFAQELHDLVAKRDLASGHRAVAAFALAAAIATDPQVDPALLIDLAGEGPREVRHAVIDGLSHAPVPALVAAAQAAATPEAAGDLWRAVTRRARTAPGEAGVALAAFAAALPTATDYERRYRIVDGLAALGDAHALGELEAGAARTALRQRAVRVRSDCRARDSSKAPRADALELLLFFMTEPDPGVRYAALTALGATESGPPGPWHAAVGADGVDRVIQTALASDTWPEVRARAAQMLGARCSRPGPARSLDDAVHRDPELAVRGDALAGLVECKAAGAADLLWKTWDNRKQPIELRQRAIDLAVELGDAGLAAKLVARFGQWRGAALESEDALALAQNAAYAVGRLAPPGAAEALAAALDDGAFPEIVAAAATGLGLMGHACPATARVRLRTLAHSDDQQIRLAAAHAAALCGK